MASKTRRIVLDTNVLVSAIVYGGKPEIILRATIDRQFTGVTSPVLIAELMEILVKRFSFSSAHAERIRQKMRRRFAIVHPTKKISILRDDPDNRVLEAAIAGRCSHIITGDKEILALKKYRSVKVVTPQQFLGLVT